MRFISVASSAFVFFMHCYQPVYCILQLNACLDFQDLRQGLQQNKMEWDVFPLKNSTRNQIIQSKVNVLDGCSKTVSRYVILDSSKNVPLVTTAVIVPKVDDLPTPETFSRYGDYFDGFHYFQKSEYCVNSLMDFTITLRVCQPMCHTFRSNPKIRLCIPKCCAPDEVLAYWSSHCVRVSPHEPKWQPVVCNGENCTQADASKIIHYHRSLISWDQNIIRHPISTVKLISFGEVFQKDEKQNIRMAVTHAGLELQRLSEKRTWDRHDVNFCADGFLLSSKDNYTSAYGDQVFFTSESENLTDKLIANRTEDWAVIVSALLGTAAMLIIVMMYVALWDQHNFNGLMILSYSISLFLGYVFHTAAYFIVIYPNPEFTGIGRRGLFCMTIAIGSHYLIFVNYAWLTLMNFNLCVSVRSIQPANSVTTKKNQKIISYSIIAWGFPALVVSAFVVVDEVYRYPLSYVTVPEYAVKNCAVAIWSRGHYVYAPLAIYLVGNGFLTVLTFKVLIAARTNAAKVFNTGKDKYTAKLFLKIFFLMGVIDFVHLVTWHFNGNKNPWYVVVMKSALLLETVPLLVLFCCNKRIVSQLEKKFPCLQEPLSAIKGFTSTFSNLPEKMYRQIGNMRQGNQTETN